MSILDKQLGPFPVKYWLIIGVGGVGIGWLVTRNSSEAKPARNDTATDVRAFNELNKKVIALSLADESIAGKYTETNTLLGDLRAQLQAIQDRLNKPVSAPSATPTRAIDPILPQLPRNDEVRMYDSQGYLRSVQYANSAIRSVV